MAFSDRTRIKHLSFAVLTALGAMTQAVPARADEAAAPNKLDTVQVTGSNIRRTDTETPSPVEVITADDLKKSGVTSISDVLRNLTANNQGTLSQSFANAFAAGASGVALRGLTVGATLVLIDGHRMTPYPLSDDGERSFVDISAIPFDAIERIEVLKDGASAVYGTDAIAGVVNIILKKSFVGTRVNVEAGLSGQGDGGTQHLSVIHGFGDLSTDGHTGYFSIEYRHQSPIAWLNRPGMLTNRDYTSYGGVDITPGVANSFNNGTQVLPGGGSINSSGATPVQTPFSPNCTGRNANGPSCPFTTSNFQLQPDTHNVNLLAKFTQTLANDWEATYSASMFSSSAEQWSQIGSGFGTTGYSVGGLYNYVAGPNIKVPGVYPANPLQVVNLNPASGNYLNGLLPSYAASHTMTDTQTYRLGFDLSGKLFGWDTSSAVGFSRALLHARNTGSVSIDGVQSLLNANTNLSDASLYQLLNSPANASLISPTTRSTSTSELDFISLGGSRELGTMPWEGGGVSALAVGLEYTHKALSSVSPDSVASGQVSGATAYAVGEQDTASAYGELDTQLLKQLELVLSGRLDEVNTYGSSATPKVGLKFTPVPEFTVRGTYSRGFRAPNPAENGNAGSVFLANTTNDPQLCPNPGTPVPNTAGNFPTQCAVQFASLSSGNPKLQPEKSHSFTLGVIFEPIKGYNVSADYYRIQIDNQIVSGSAAQPFTNFLPLAVRTPPVTLPGYNSAGQLVTLTTPVGLIEYVPVPYQNANTTVTSGIDLDFNAAFNLGEYGKLKSELNINHVFHYELTAQGATYELAGTHGPLSISGDTGTPQTRAAWHWTWEQGPAEVAMTVNYISHFGVTDPSQGLNDCSTGVTGLNLGFSFGAPVNPLACEVASFTTFDFYGAYQLSKQWTVHGSVNNAFNRSAPLDLATYGGTNYNPALHQEGAVGRYFNVGATYDF